MKNANLRRKTRRPARAIGLRPRCLAFEDLEQRELLSAESLQFAGQSLRRDALGRRAQDASGALARITSAGARSFKRQATVSYATDVVHAGQGAMRIDTNGTIAAGAFDFVQVVLGATGYALPYMDTRDLTHYESFSFWIRNQTGRTRSPWNWASRTIATATTARPSRPRRCPPPINGPGSRSRSI